MRFVKQPPGASQKLVDQVAAKFSVAIPQDLAAFWQRSDGAILWFGYKELQFFSTNEVLNDDSYRLHHYMPYSLPICMDGDGNICVARIEQQEITSYFVVSCGNLAWDDAVKISNSFEQFLSDPLSPERRLHA